MLRRFSALQDFPGASCDISGMIFREELADDYEDLDRRCEKLTLNESRLGEFLECNTERAR
jgi:hypothetical protein